MSDQDVFEEAEKETPSGTPAALDAAEPQEPLEGQPAQPANDYTDQLSQILNADGTPKYSTVADALSSIPHAQTHIATIEGENASLKEQLAKAQAAKELLEKAAGDNANQPTSLTPEEVAEITQRTMTAQEEAKREAANVGAVNAKFSELYGEKAATEMKKLAKDSDMSIAEIRALAARSPAAVYRLAGITSPSATPPPSRTPGVGVGDNFQPAPKQPEPGKSVMNGATTKDMIASWKAAGEVIKQQG